MDNYRSNDAEVESITGDQSEDDWADSDVIRLIAEDLKEAYIQPLDRATQAKHLAAIADAISQTTPSPRVLPPTQRTFTDGSRCASGFVKAAGPARVAQASNANLASPFGARTAVVSSGSGAGQVSSLRSVGNPAEAKTAQIKWLRPAAFVNSIASKAAVIATAIAMSASGLAIAGALPDPVQTAFSEAAGVIGLDIPAPIQPPAVSPAPPKEQEVPTPADEPELIVPQEPLPVPVVPAPPAAERPGVQPPQPSTQIVPPAGPPADLESWLTELIRQALAAANAQATYPQAAPGAGTGQQSSGQSAGQSWTQDSWWQYYGQSSAQAKPTTSSPSPSPSATPSSQYGYPQGRSTSRPAGGSSSAN